jgi:putative ABC transport system ATP-binding protein
MEPLMELRHAFKIYHPGEGEVRALDDVSLKIAKGEFVTIVGQSGSGKSTLMNLLGCLDVPSCGKYLLEGQDTAGMDDRKLSAVRNRKIGFVFQGFNLIPGLSAEENVELPLIYRGMERELRRRLCREALEQVGLSARAGHLPGQMSGGQQQRVAIARAIAARPPVILADEPTGNLDSRSGGEIMEILRGLRQGGRTVVLITHDEAIAARTERLIRVADGKIRQDIFHRPTG